MTYWSVNSYPCGLHLFTYHHFLLAPGEKSLSNALHSLTRRARSHDRPTVCPHWGYRLWLVDGCQSSWQVICYLYPLPRLLLGSYRASASLSNATTSVYFQHLFTASVQYLATFERAQEETSKWVKKKKKKKINVQWDSLADSALSDIVIFA